MSIKVDNISYIYEKGTGFERQALKNVSCAIEDGEFIGLIGHTGSGKSTTMCAMLSELAGEEVNVVTLEDPVEYNIAGVNQCQINEKTGMTFASGLMAVQIGRAHV